MTIEILLGIFAGIIAKHYIVGYLWRTPIEVANAGNLRHRAAYTRGMKHVIASLPIYSACTVSWPWFLGALVIEFAATVFSEVYHGMIQRSGKWESKIDRQYWFTFGLKEAFQLFASLLIVAVLVAFAPFGFQGL
jgi:flagellar biosynthesis protein FlhB